MDGNQTREQARYRSGYSTNDHMRCLSQLTVKHQEYQIPLCLTFIDYEKAFYSYIQAVLDSFEDQDVGKKCISD